jgi:tRNA threonylcarbamoyladenosine biosynthesis protein TsaE
LSIKNLELPHLTAQVFESDSVEATEAIAARIAAMLHGGECIALDGDLGAGKTQFVRGLVRALSGDPRQVSSPTFVLLHIYQHDTAGRAMRLPVYHLDAYRVSGPTELEAIGFTELLEQGAVVVVEWAQRIADLLPANRIHVVIQHTGLTDRRIAVSQTTGTGEP